MKKIVIYFVFCFTLFSCSDDTQEILDEPEQEENPSQDNPEETPDDPDDSQGNYDVIGEVELYNEDLVSDQYVLINDAGFNRVYLINKDKAEIHHEWDLESGIGNDAELLEDSELLVSLIDNDRAFGFGGYGGIIQLVNPDNSVKWSYKISSEFELAHHDVERLPNGNVLALVWEGKVKSEAQDDYGYTYDDEVIYAEKLVEINPTSNEIVWQWSSWDHSIQEVDETKPHFGKISENPQLIDINYRDPLREGNYNEDIMHANGIEYDEQNDVIYISINFYSEVWVVDHSTTTAEASGSTGGALGKGGDLVYRFGNPEVYGNSEGMRSFYHNHGINKIENTNNILIFVNGGLGDVTQSTVYELALPEVFDLKPDSNNELEEVWSFTDPDLFAPRVSSAYRLKNGNTLITEGDYGCWEVTSSKEVVWKYNGTGFIWRAYPYEKDDDRLSKFEL